jgi:hypothetical protein
VIGIFKVFFIWENDKNIHGTLKKLKYNNTPVLVNAFA